MKNSEYWLKRAQQLENAQTKKNAEYFDGELERLYQKAIRDTEKDLARWYTRFAKNNSITMAEAKKLLSSRELEEFKWTVEEYIDYGMKNAVSGEWMKQLENVSQRYHISRLEALKLQMQNHVEVLMRNEVDGVTDLIRDHLEDGYYRTAFEIQKFVGIGTSFSQLDEDTIEKLLSKPWTSDGTNFSTRICGTHKTELVNDLHKKLTQAIIMGENPKVLAKGFAKYVSDEAAKSFRSKKSRAENLVMTETSFFRSAGQKRCYEELGVEEFENCATLDSKTSETCRDMDGTHFPVSEMQPGLNCPPFHNRCRTATCPYFDDEFTADEMRAARAEDGSYYTVPANMTYREWERKLGKNTGLQNEGEYGIIDSEKDIDYMSNSFRPKYGAESVLNAGSIKIPVKRVINSAFEMYTDVENTGKNKAVRLTEKNMRIVSEMMDTDFEMPKIVVVDFDKYGFEKTAIGGYDRHTKTMYINSKYDTNRKINEYVNAQEGYFANNTMYAPYLHELGHKQYEDALVRYAEKNNVSVDKARYIVENKLSEYISEKRKEDIKFIDTNISGYANKSYEDHAYSEIFAESISSCNFNEATRDILIIIGLKR